MSETAFATWRPTTPDRLSTPHPSAFSDCGPPLPSRDVLHEVEVRRDPSPILSLTVEEWVTKLLRAGFEVEAAQARELDWNYEEWMGNQSIETELSAELAELIEEAEGEARGQLQPGGR